MREIDGGEWGDGLCVPDSAGRSPSLPLIHPLLPLISSAFSSGVGRQPRAAEGNAATHGTVARLERAGGLSQSYQESPVKS